jgi:AbiTii
MTGLVLELQRQALERGSSSSELLRKALVICRKLGIVDIEQWIQQELNGYDGSLAIPQYREVRGELKAWNPYHGWIPLRCADPKFSELYSKREISQAIGALEDMKSNLLPRSTLHVPFTPTEIGRLNAGMRLPLQPTLQISGASIVGILDAVRNRILEWTLELERAGNTGVGMTFSNEERTAMTAVTYQFTNNIEAMNNSQIQQHSSGSQSMRAELDVAGIKELLSSVLSALNDYKVSEPVTAEVRADIATLNAQMDSPKPKVGIIREGLRSLRTVLEEAAGNVLGGVLMSRLDAVIGALPFV